MRLPPVTGSDSKHYTRRRDFSIQHVKKYKPSAIIKQTSNNKFLCVIVISSLASLFLVLLHLHSFSIPPPAVIRTMPSKFSTYKAERKGQHKSSCWQFKERADYEPFFIYDKLNDIFHFDMSVKQYQYKNPRQFLVNKYKAPSNYIDAINGNQHKFYNIHSHNDYWRSLPLFDALERNYRSVEADVWYLPSKELRSQCSYSKHAINQTIDDALGSLKHSDIDYKEAELYVGHQLYLLTKHKTINSLYLNLLETILNDRNKDQKDKTKGLFSNFPDKSLNFIIDIKTPDSYLVYQLLLKKLQPLQKYLSYYDFTENRVIENQINIILSGFVPLEEIIAQDASFESQNLGRRYVFIDAEIMKHKPEPSPKLVILASTSYGRLLKPSASGTNTAAGLASTAVVKAKLDQDNTQDTRLSQYYAPELLSKSQLEKLKSHTDEIKEASAKSATYFVDTRIWGVPQYHYSFQAFLPPEMWTKFLGWLSIGNGRAKRLDMNIWKDLIINGGVTMINIDDLDFGMEVYNEVMASI